MALLYPSRAALGAALLRLASSGYPIEGASDHGVSQALYLADPEGNGIELYADRPKAAWPRRGDTLAMVAEPLDLDALMNESQAAGMEGGESVRELRMGHVHLHVAHLEPAVVFYHEGLGLNLIQRYGSQAAFLAAGDYHHHVGINTWAGVGAPQPPAASPGLRRFTLVLPSCEALQATLTQLRATGAPLYEIDGMHQTQDPSGNRVYLVVSLPPQS
jgi:catechol 2,3-dioxygenase